MAGRVLQCAGFVYLVLCSARDPSSVWTLALALLVSGVRANHHDAAVAADDLAVIADLLNAGLDLHVVSLCISLSSYSRGAASRYFPAIYLLVAVNDSAAGQVVGRQLHNYAVLGEDADVVLAHFARNVCENFVPIAELNAEHRVGQSLEYVALDFDDAVFLGHSLTIA